MIVVSNSTPLIGLASIGRFELLQQLFGEIQIATTVYAETVTMGREEGGAKRQVSAATWIKTMAVQDRLAVEVLLDELDMGEAGPERQAVPLEPLMEQPLLRSCPLLEIERRQAGPLERDARLLRHLAQPFADAGGGHVHPVVE